MNLQTLKSHWIFTLKNVIIAGGFFRDNFLGVPVKDIDIYCLPQHHDNVKNQLHHRIAEDITVSNKKFSNLSVAAQEDLKSRYEQQKTLSITTINKYLTWQGEILELIVTNNATSAEGLIQTFDYTVNTIAWPGETGQISHCASTLRDLWAMELVVVRAPSDERKKYMMGKGFKERT